MGHPCCGMCQCSISFYGWMILHYTEIPHFYNPFIRWWTSGLSPLFGCKEHLSTFCIDLWFHFSGGVVVCVYLVVELLGHTVTLRLTFWGIAKLFSKAVTQFCIPTSSVCVFQSPHIPYLLLCLFDYRLLSGCVSGIWWFWLAFLWSLMLNLFCVLCGHMPHR